MSKRSMKAKGLHIHAQMLEIPIPVGVDLLPLQRFQEALTTSVVMRVCRPAHARDPLVLLKGLHILARGILNAPIRVMHQAGSMAECDNIVKTFPCISWRPTHPLLVPSVPIRHISI